MNAVINVENINKYFGERHVVKDLSLEVGKGQIYGFLGPNGSGKTTSIRMMCGLLTPDSGTGSCLGYDILKDSFKIKAEIGYMTQKFSYWDDLTIRENLEFVARIYGLRDIKNRVGTSLDRLGLTARQNQLAGTLSGGWKQRMALAACMLHEPKLLLLDEPTAGVDPAARREFWEELHNLAADGISVLVSTHYMDEAERCHKLAYIFQGKLLIKGSPREILDETPLCTFSLTGGVVHDMALIMQRRSGVEQSAVFGDELHITGRDRESLEEALSFAESKGMKSEEIETTLEDLFIYLMNSAK